MRQITRESGRTGVNQIQLCCISVFETGPLVNPTWDISEKCPNSFLRLRMSIIKRYICLWVGGNSMTFVTSTPPKWVFGFSTPPLWENSFQQETSANIGMFTVPPMWYKFLPSIPGTQSSCVRLPVSIWVGIMRTWEWRPSLRFLNTRHAMIFMMTVSGITIISQKGDLGDYWWQEKWWVLRNVIQQRC